MALGLLICVLGGCGLAGGGGTPRLGARASGGGYYEANLPTRFCTVSDENTADFYLTDLPRDVWSAGADATRLRGVILHVHMFLQPRAGRTPLDTSASSCIVRLLVLSGGEIGVYGGGGLFTRAGDPDDASVGGRLANGTVRLTRATGGFIDPVGPSVLAGSFSCARDDREAMLIGRAMAALASYATPIEPVALASAGGGEDEREP